MLRYFFIFEESYIFTVVRLVVGGGDQAKLYLFGGGHVPLWSSNNNATRTNPSLEQPETSYLSRCKTEKNRGHISISTRVTTEAVEFVRLYIINNNNIPNGFAGG